MRCKLKHTVEYKIAPLEENVSPVPTIILDDVMRLSFHPEVEANER